MNLQRTPTWYPFPWTCSASPSVPRKWTFVLSHVLPLICMISIKHKCLDSMISYYLIVPQRCGTIPILHDLLRYSRSNPRCPFRELIFLTSLVIKNTILKCSLSPFPSELLLPSHRLKNEQQNETSRILLMNSVHYALVIKMLVKSLNKIDSNNLLLFASLKYSEDRNRPYLILKCSWCIWLYINNSILVLCSMAITFPLLQLFESVLKQTKDLRRGYQTGNLPPLLKVKLSKKPNIAKRLETSIFKITQKPYKKRSKIIPRKLLLLVFILWFRVPLWDFPVDVGPWRPLDLFLVDPLLGSIVFGRSR